MENRQGQQAGLYQVEAVQDAPGATVSIREGMNGLELVVPYSETKRIGETSCVPMRSACRLVD
jgi:hypothetical protein